jgi:hypothetical protein
MRRVEDKLQWMSWAQRPEMKGRDDPITPLYPSDRSRERRRKTMERAKRAERAERAKRSFVTRMFPSKLP